MEDLGAFVRHELGMHNLAAAASSCVLCNQQSASTRPAKSGRCEIKVLHCLHSVCGGCLEDHLQHGKEVLCPLCDARTVERNYHSYLCNFPEHQGIDYQAIGQQKRIECEECLDNADAVCYCEQCVRSLCAECSEHHKRSKATNMHLLITLQDQQENKMHRAAFCVLHSAPHEFFCKDCSVMCCRDCILADHESHSYQLPASGLVEKEREVVSHQISELRGLARQLQEKHQLLMRLMKEIDAGLEQSKASVEQMEGEVKKAIQQRREAIMEEINSFSIWHRLALDKKRSMLTSTMVSAWSVVDFVNKVLSRGTDIEVLFLRSSISLPSMLIEEFCNLNAIGGPGDRCASIAFQRTTSAPELLEAIRSMGTAATPSPLAPAELSHPLRRAPSAISRGPSSSSLAAPACGEAMPLKVVSKLAAEVDAIASVPLACKSAVEIGADTRASLACKSYARQQLSRQADGPAEAPGGSMGGGDARARDVAQIVPARAGAGAEEPEVSPEPPAAVGASAEAGRRREGSREAHADSCQSAQPEAERGQSSDGAESALKEAKERKARRRRGGKRSADKSSAPMSSGAVPLTPGIVIRAAAAGASPQSASSPADEQQLPRSDPPRRQPSPPPPPTSQTRQRGMSLGGGVHSRTDEEVSLYGLGPRRALLGCEGTGPGMFRSPCGMCTDTDHVYIADTLNQRIQVFDRFTHEQLGLVTLPKGSQVGALQDPSGLCCVGDRQLRVVEYGLDRLLSVELSEDSLEVKKACVLADTQLYGPFGVGQFQGRIVVCDSCNHRCLVMSSGGDVLLEIGGRGVDPGQFEYPDCVATFSDGYFAVSDKDNHRVQVFDVDGNFSQFVPSNWAPRAPGSRAAPPGQLRGPMGMCTDSRDRLYVCDCGSNRVQIFTRQGHWLWSSDGPGSLCSFCSPTAIQIDKGGNVYIASDHCVQIF